MQLYNTLSAEERANLIDQAGEDRLTLSFYKYAQIKNPSLFRDHLFIHWNQLNVLGRIYVAYEGINAQLSVPANQFDPFKTHLDSISFLKEFVVFSVYRKNSDWALFSIKKTPKNSKYGRLYSLVAMDGRILKCSNDLKSTLRVLKHKELKLNLV